MDGNIIGLFFFILVLVIGFFVFLIVLIGRSRRGGMSRKEYYREYLKSEAWQRKRYVVLKRDNWTCKYCGAKATEVHHLKYAKYQIGKEPIKWLVSVCRPCHRKQH